VYGSSGVLPTSQTNAAFNVCVTYVAMAAPVNDNCAGAITLPVRSTCVKTPATLTNATASGIAATCGGNTGLDVWFKFVATGTTQTVNVGDYAPNYPIQANRRLQLFSGTCAALGAALYCNSNSNSINATGLTVGANYFIRVFVTNTTVITTLAEFSICVYNTPASVRYGNSYVNVTKKTTGGVVEPNDILEIRMTINVSSGAGGLTNMRYLDSVPTHTVMLTTAADKISVITNEGIVLQSYTTTAGDDPASYVASPGAGGYQVRLNLGFDGVATPTPAPGTPANNLASESASALGLMDPATDIPRGGAGVLFATSFRVRVNGIAGDTIRLAAGKFVYRAGAGDIVLTGTPYKILISSPMNLCPNSTGINMTDEFGGTFGTGSTLNRGTDLFSPISGYDFVSISAYQALLDGQYSIVKNMSPRSGTNRNAERSPTTTTVLPDQDASAYRMHGGHWDIDGDHTGTNNAIGNTPKGDGVSAGYMIMVNADYIASETYKQTLNNLCPSTYYEFSAWVRNICPTCGINSATNSNWSPRQPGVAPNLTFALDGLDRYSTGEVDYTSGWIKKGFVFLTDTNQTTANFSIRNNSQGGGGNDWVMDDITVATCLPTMLFSPSLNPTICSGTYITLADTVTSFFNNYINYKWQRSTNGGGSWSDLSGAQVGTNGPYGSQFRYTATYTVPPANTNVGNSGDLYRVIVATKPNNLINPSCQVSDGISLITLNIIDCGAPLKTDLLSFNGRLTDDDRASLSWITSKEEGLVKYYIERSIDGTNFSQVGYVNGYNNGNATNQYSFIDPAAVTGKVYYRISAVNEADNKKYTNIIQVARQKSNSFALANVVNPFNQKIDLSITAPNSMKVDIELVDLFGKIVARKSFLAQTGINLLSLTDTEPLPAGTYVLRVSNNDQVITRKILKKNNL
jgi:hypothetical protein